MRVPGWAILQSIEISEVDPHRLLTGEGEHYRARSEGSLRRSVRQGSSPRRGRSAPSAAVRPRLEPVEGRPALSWRMCNTSPVTPN